MTLKKAIEKAAQEVLGGGDAVQLVKDLAKSHRVKEKEVKAQLNAKVAELVEAQSNAARTQKAEPSKDEESKGEESSEPTKSQAELDAEQAEREAEEHERLAKQRRAEAEAQAAALEGKVVVNVPTRYKLNIGGVITEYQPGPQKMLAEHANHWYSKAVGVQVVE